MKLIKNLYIHFPFCFKKCHFCDFSINSYITHETTKEIYQNYNIDFNKDKKIKNYINNLNIEFMHFNKNYSNKLSEIETIYLGGGTPSILDEENIKFVIYSLQNNFNIRNNKNLEIIIEADPNTFDKQKLKTLFSLGINKINLGIQTFNEKILIENNRSHNLYDSFKAIDLILESDYHLRFGIELLQGLPFSDQKTIKFDLEEIILKRYKNKIPHVSVNIFNIDKDMDFLNTNKKKFHTYEEIQKNSELLGFLELKKFEEFREKYLLEEFQGKLAEYFISTHDTLTSNNYDHYNITDYSLINSKNPRENYSKHNEIYFNGNSEYIGFGSGSSSYFMNRYFKKPQNLIEYEEYILKLKKSLDIENNNKIQLNKVRSDNLIERYIFNLYDNEYFTIINSESNKNEYLKFILANQIRRKEGINLKLINDHFSNRIYLSIKKFFNRKQYKEYLEIYYNDKYKFEFAKLIFPQGALLCDTIIQNLIQEINF